MRNRKNEIGSVVSSDGAVMRGFAVVVVLVALFGGLWAVFASSARADSHTVDITVACDSYDIALSDYDDPGDTPEVNGIMILIDGVREFTTDFADSFSRSAALDRSAAQEVIIIVFDPEDPDGVRARSFARFEISPACEEPATTTTAPATTTSVTAAPSTLPFTGAEAVSSALLAVVLFGSGALILLITRRAED